jgi:hypothetical protein
VFSGKLDAIIVECSRSLEIVSEGKSVKVYRRGTAGCSNLAFLERLVSSAADTDNFRLLSLEVSEVVTNSGSRASSFVVAWVSAAF